MSSEFIHFNGLYDWFVLSKQLRIIYERKHEHFTQKIYNQPFAHNHELNYIQNK